MGIFDLRVVPGTDGWKIVSSHFSKELFYDDKDSAKEAKKSIKNYYDIEKKKLIRNKESTGTYKNSFGYTHVKDGVKKEILASAMDNYLSGGKRSRKSSKTRCRKSLGRTRSSKRRKSKRHRRSSRRRF